MRDAEERILVSMARQGAWKGDKEERVIKKRDCERQSAKKFKKASIPQKIDCRRDVDVERDSVEILREMIVRREEIKGEIDEGR